MGRSDQTQRVNAALLRLTIDGVGLIDHAEVAFADGFTVFTGETGSGKTMLLGALDAALGARVERDLIRGERARVTLELEPGPVVRARLEAEGIALAADDEVVIVREIGANGRGQARVNGVAVSATQLRELGALIVDAIGQGEAQRFLEAGYARELLTASAVRRPRRCAPRCANARRAARLRGRADALVDGGERALAERGVRASHWPRSMPQRLRPAMTSVCANGARCSERRADRHWRSRAYAARSG